MIFVAVEALSRRIPAAIQGLGMLVGSSQGCPSSLIGGSQRPTSTPEIQVRGRLRSSPVEGRFDTIVLADRFGDPCIRHSCPRGMSIRRQSGGTDPCTDLGNLLRSASSTDSYTPLKHEKDAQSASGFCFDEAFLGLLSMRE